MEIIHVELEKPFTVMLKNQRVEIVTFLTSEPGNIKFGITSPRNVRVNREEVQALLEQAG